MHRFFRLRSTIVTTALFCLAAAVILPGTAGAHTAPEAALQAQEMLGRSIWSKVVEVENTNESSRYPATLFATVFEFDDVLWFFTSTGTQPIELSRNRVADYQDDLLPLLQTIERFSSVKVVPPSAEPSEEFPHLVNGCVIESIFTLEQLRMSGEQIQKAKLLLYSTERSTRRRLSEGNPRGHAVLVFETPEGRFFVDPPEIKTVKQLTTGGEWHPAEIAAAIETPHGAPRIGRAFFVPVDQPEGSEETPQFYSGER